MSSSETRRRNGISTGSADHVQRLGRRAFLQGGVLLLSAAAVDRPASLWGDQNTATLRFGMMTDLHHADKPPAGTRHYRESRVKLAEAATEFEKRRIDFVVELGDLIDAAESVDTELAYLKSINREFSNLSKDRHYVLGNHCVDTLTKAEFLDQVEQAKSYYSFNRDSYHFVVLDACFRSDGMPYGRKNSVWTDTIIPAEEIEWLRADLRSADRKTIVFAHQRLDVSNSHGVKNGDDVRKILEESGKVLAVFQGHSHQNDLKEIGGIPYCTLVAMVEGAGVENNGYCVVELAGSGSIRVDGFRKQRVYEWPVRR